MDRLLKSFSREISSLLAIALVLMPVLSFAQTRISPPKNGYSVEQDVQLGRQAAAEISRQFPLLPDNSDATRYVQGVGRRLVNAIPQQFQQPSFRYEFRVVNARDINAFALPGGPMFVNRGMIESSQAEGEMAGVMAHELSHVVLRHGTAQATKQQSAKYQLPALGGAILGAIIGGGLGGVVAQGSQMGVGALLLKYSREYETQADVLGAQIMARAGYDPRDLANMFRIIERESGGGGGGPEWMSSHPNPGNRYERIEQEASMLRVSGNSDRTGAPEFNRVKNELRRMSPAPTMAEIERGAARNQGGGQSYPEDSRIDQRVESPSGSYRTYTASNLFRVNIPNNWQQFESQESITFAPRGAFGNYQGQSVFTHGAVVGVVNSRFRSLEDGFDAYVGSLLRGNSYLQPQGQARRTSVNGRRALMISLTGQSPVTHRAEIVNVYATQLSNGALFYIVNVSPRDEYQYYQRAFNTMLSSIQLNG